MGVLRGGAFDGDLDEVEITAGGTEVEHSLAGDDDAMGAHDGREAENLHGCTKPAKQTKSARLT